MVRTALKYSREIGCFNKKERGKKVSPWHQLNFTESIKNLDWKNTILGNLKSFNSIENLAPHPQNNGG